MAPFLTVKEASRLTGKSPTSIRRLIYPIIHDNKHADRGHIQPAVAEATKLRLKGENFAWRLSEELVRREFDVENPAARVADSASARAQRHQADPGLLDMLRAELEIKNRQISQQSEMLARQMELISGLTERVRESNVLIGSLQHRFALPAPGHTTEPITASVEMIPAKQKRATSNPAEKGSSIPPKPKQKKSLLARLFG